MWELDYKESWAPKHWCFWTVVLETPESPLDCKEIQPVNPKGNQSVQKVHWKDWCWSWNSNPLATWCKELTHWKKPWCWKKLKVGGEGDDRRYDGQMASPRQWTWDWVGSGSWWWTGKPGVLVHGVVKSQTPLSDWTELNKIRQWRELSFSTGHRPKSWFNFPWPGMLPEDSKISGLLVKQSLPLSVILGNQGSAMTEMGPEIDASQSRKVIKHTTHTHTHTHTHTRECPPSLLYFGQKPLCLAY